MRDAFVSLLSLTLLGEAFCFTTPCDEGFDWLAK